MRRTCSGHKQRHENDCGTGEQQCQFGLTGSHHWLMHDGPRQRAEHRVDRQPHPPDPTHTAISPVKLSATTCTTLTLCSTTLTAFLRRGCGRPSQPRRPSAGSGPQSVHPASRCRLPPRARAAAPRFPPAAVPTLCRRLWQHPRGGGGREDGQRRVSQNPIFKKWCHRRS